MTGARHHHDQGRALLARLDAKAVEAQRELLAPLDEAQRATFDALLAALVSTEGGAYR